MNNLIKLTARVLQIQPLKYTPTEIPVLDVTPQHEFWQEENGQKCLVKFKVPARIPGKQAKKQQYRQGVVIESEGFLAQRSQRFPRSVLRIQNIKEYKGQTIMARQSFKRRKLYRLTAEKIQEVDYEQIDLLKDSISENDKIIPVHVTGIRAHYQRQLTTAVKCTRSLALLPYTNQHK